MKWERSLLVLCVILVAVNASSFVHISDLHVNQNYSATELDASCSGAPIVDNEPVARYGCDTSPLLFNLTKIKLAEVINTYSPDFVIVSGDFASHGLKTADLVSSDIAETTHNISAETSPLVIPVIGNCDNFPSYTIPFGPNPWLSELYSLWSGVGWLSDSDQDTFNAGGYYVRKVRDSFWIIVLNTVYYSKHWQSGTNTAAPKHDDPAGQFAWLEQTLSSAQASSAKVMVVGHIPPSNHPESGGAQWPGHYNTDFLTIITPYLPSTITALLFGHQHLEDIRLVQSLSSQQSAAVSQRDADTAVTEGIQKAARASGVVGGLLLAPSISTRDGNNPAFRIVDYDAQSGLIYDYTQFYLNVTAANLDPSQAAFDVEYTFKNLYSQIISADAPIDGNALQALYKYYGTDEGFEVYWQVHYCGREGVPRSASQKDYLCAIAYIDKDAFQQCTQS